MRWQAGRVRRARSAPRGKATLWSELEWLEPRRLLDSTTVFNEVMHDPAGDATEWIELYNQLATRMDLSGWSIGGGIDYAFPEGTAIEPHGFLVVAADPSRLSGVDAIGPFDGRLSNEGERIELRNNSRRLMSVMDYGVSDAWPVAANGSGASLAKRDEWLAVEPAENWTFSRQVGGTPGAANFPENAPAEHRIQFNEIAGAGTNAFFVELANRGQRAIDLGDLRIATRSGAAKDLVSGELQPGELRGMVAADLGFEPEVDEPLFLMTRDGLVLDGQRAAAEPHGWHDSTTRWLRAATPTPGAANDVRLRDEIVIHEIMYHAAPQLSSPETPARYEQWQPVGFDSVWRYNESGSDLGEAWYERSHSVGGDWRTGSGLIGYLPPALAPPLPIGTTVAPPAESQVATYYFETDFVVAPGQLQALEAVRLRHVLDDGAIVYLNGEELLRYQMPEGSATGNTFASVGVGVPVISEPMVVASELLREGVNRLSVSVHQVSRTSIDVLFGLELSADWRVAEAMPGTEYQDNALEYLELLNTSDRPVDLTGWRLSEAIDYTFPAATTIAPQQFLVVARDVPQVKAAYPELIDIVGGYRGSLSNRGEAIQLLDERGNPADEVHYFDGGQWDWRADGHGPSLELLDPRADNSFASAWQASDDTDRSQWNTYTYRGIGGATIRGEPSVWREFLLGFLDGAGEALIDDVSVVEDPDGDARQLIQNGSFDEGAAHWRLLGNHQSSRVVEEDGNPVLHLIADGATEYQGNQVETTFVENRAVRRGVEYEVSFRAKWLAGSRQLNSRLYFNQLPRVIALDAPSSFGTPGRANSVSRTNLGPTMTTLRHTPALPRPGEPILVTVDARDPDGVAQVLLHYRVDGEAWNQQAMELEASSRYTATISGQAAGTVVQFYVEAIDGNGQQNVYPAAGTDSRALLQVDDGRGTRTQLTPFRLVMLTSDVNHLHASTNSLSNQRLGATVISGDEVFYDVGVRLKGSFVGRDAVRVGFNITFPPEQLFRGVHDKVAVDRSTHATLGIDEIILKHTANRAGDIPSSYDDLIDFVAPRAMHTGVAMLRMAGFDELYLDTQFENGSEGTVYEYEVLRWATTTIDGNPESLKRAGGLDAPNGYANIEIQDLGDDKEAYRWTNLILNNRTRDDYSSIIAMGKAFSERGDALYERTREVLDIDQWMRTAAYQSLFQPGDAYFTGSNLHNFRLYARPDGKVLYMPWDWDSAFQGGTRAPLIGSSRLSQIVRFPSNLRVFYGHMLDIVDRAFHAEYLDEWVEHYEAISGQRLTSRLSFVETRSAYVRDRIERELPPIEFSVTTPSQSVPAASLVIEGQGWVNVREIRVAETGQTLEPSWSGGRVADQWAASLPLAFGSHPYTLQAIDYQGNVLGQQELVLESTVDARPLAQFLRLTEIHYHPADDSDTEFLEFTNIADDPLAPPIDLAGVAIGAGPSAPFVFAPGTILEAGESVLVVQDRDAFLQAYPQVPPTQLAGQFAGRLSNAGERLWVTDPLGATLLDLVYDDAPPWPTTADGAGNSLQLLTPLATAADWAEARSWQSARPTPGTTIVPTQPGDFNQDQRVDVRDIDLLWLELRQAAPNARFDLNGDARVDQQDWQRMIVDIAQARFGDANLDGRFDSADFVLIFQSGEYEDAVVGNSTWAEGDWNGDGEFSSADLVLAFQSGEYSANTRASQRRSGLQLPAEGVATYEKTLPR